MPNERMRRQNSARGLITRRVESQPKTWVIFAVSFNLWQSQTMLRRFSLQIVEFPDNPMQVVETSAIGIVGESRELSPKKGPAIGG